MSRAVHRASVVATSVALVAAAIGFAPAASAVACPTLAVETPSGSGVCVWGLTGAASIPTTIPAGVTSVDVLLVGGGGGGGGGYSKPGSGGGGGAVRLASNVSVSAGAAIVATIGSGGAGGVVAGSGADGASGSSSTLTFGGLAAAATAQGGTGGKGSVGSRSGGGSSGYTEPPAAPSANGSGGIAANPAGGGGGGASGSGSDATNSAAGAGGSAFSPSSGSWVTVLPLLSGGLTGPFGGGGGGGGAHPAGSTGGAGGQGAGAGGNGTSPANAGGAGTKAGGGGGGGSAIAGGGAAGGRGADGIVLIAFTYTPPATAPDAPTSLVATDGDAQTSIAFTAGSNNGAAITNYKYSTDNGGTWQAFSPAVTSSPAIIGSLTNGVTYQVMLKAVNSAGDGAASTAVSVSPVSSTPPAPPPTPSAPAASTPEPAIVAPVTTLPVRQALDPVPPGTTASIPAAGLSPDQTAALLGGAPEAVATRSMTIGDASAVEMVGSSFTMAVGAASTEARSSTGTSSLTFAPGGRAVIQGSGYESDTEIRFFIFSDPTDLGVLRTDGEGRVRGEIALPRGLPSGTHTFQAVGYARDGLVRALSLGVLMSSEQAPAVRTRVARATIHFTALSSRLSSGAQASLKRLARGPGRSAVRSIVVGYVQDSGVNSNDRALAVARAHTVAAYLQSMGVKGSVAQRASSSHGSGWAGRKAVVTIRYVT